MGLGIVLINLDDADLAKNLLRAEMTKRDVSTQKLTELLQERGMSITRAAVDNRISRGAFTADFFLECLRAIGCNNIGLVSESEISA
jgi:Domain of unknown function (DUF6471)